MGIEFILIRHGQTQYNREGRIQGHLDSDLTDHGKEEVRKLGLWMAEHMTHFDVWYSSPMPRARITSELLRETIQEHAAATDAQQSAPSLPPARTDDRLKEIYCGEFEGRTIAELPHEALQNLRMDPTFPYPGGESIEDVIQRVGSFLDEVERTHTDPSLPGMESEVSSVDREQKPLRIAIISHGNANRCMAAHLTGLGGPFALTVMQSNTGFSRLKSSPSGHLYRLLTWNETPHLNRPNSGKTV